MQLAPQAPGNTPAYSAPSAPAPAPENLRRGVTFEANLGFGLIWATSEGMSSDTESALAGLDLGVGGWLNHDMALSVRVAGASFSPIEGVRFTTGFLGPSLQYWATPNIWLGGGLGLGVVTATIEGEDSESETGLGLDLRAGYTFSSRSDHTFNLSIELNPGFFEVDGASTRGVSFNSLGFLVGYQHL